MDKRTAATLLDLMILVVAAVCVAFTYRQVEHPATRLVLICIFTAIPVGVLIGELICHLTRHRAIPRVSPSLVVLLGEDERAVHSWPLGGLTGVLVGKSADEVQADIDLSDTAYSECIDPAHLALNFANTGWWAQDLSSRNGSGIRRNGQDILLSPGHPVQVYIGDVILLADQARLAIQ